MERLSDKRIIDWTTGRPSDPITGEGVAMALEIRELRAVLAAVKRACMSTGTSISVHGSSALPGESVSLLRELVQREHNRVPAGEQYDWERYRLAACLKALA